MSKAEIALDRWFQSPPGQALLQLEAEVLAKLIASKWGDHCVQIGGPASKLLRCASPIIHHILLKQTDCVAEEASLVINHYDELALMPNSVDLIIVPHGVELVHDPKHFFKEIYQALKPEGLLVMLCFNPSGIGSLWRLQAIRQHFPRLRWRSTYGLLEDLQSVGFSQLRRYSVGFQPGLGQEELRSCWGLDKAIAWFCPLAGAVSIVTARKEETGFLLNREKSPAFAWGEVS